jgi:hypothetical protein
MVDLEGLKLPAHCPHCAGKPQKIGIFLKKNIVKPLPAALGNVLGDAQVMQQRPRDL